MHIFLFYYRNVLQKARELGLHTIALPIINSVRKNYPPDAGAHIALRKYKSKYLYKFKQLNLNEICRSLI